MKNVLFIMLGLLCNSLIAQLKIDSTFNSRHYDLITESSPYTIYTCSNNYTGNNDPSIHCYDQNLNPIDTLTGTDAGRPSCRFFHSFNFNSKVYVFGRDNNNTTARRFSIHRISNRQFSDSIALNLDTINNASPSYTSQVDDNTLRVILTTSVAGSLYGKVLDLDSNFNFKAYYSFDLSGIKNSPQRILSIYEVNDSLWHVYTTTGLGLYNPKTKQLLSAKIIFGEIHTHKRLSPTEYLAFGLSSVLGRPPFRNTAQSSLGFYKVNSNGTFIDTVAFNAYSHLAIVNFIEYSSEETQSNTNVLVYDSSTVYLAGQGMYTPPSTNVSFRYFHVVKTNYAGDLLWRWIWGNYDGSNGTAKYVTFYTIAPTPDQGCVIAGKIRNQGMLIKLGPDGNISNVELDAPETVVSFFPNPVKDKLHYSFLPEGKGPYTIEILDMQGKPALESTLDSEKGFIPVALKSGFYLYNLIDEKDKVQQMGKLLVKE